jgi:hypothetical protein
VNPITQQWRTGNLNPGARLPGRRPGQASKFDANTVWEAAPLSRFQASGYGSAEFPARNSTTSARRHNPDALLPPSCPLPVDSLENPTTTWLFRLNSRRETLAAAALRAKRRRALTAWCYRPSASDRPPYNPRVRSQTTTTTTPLEAGAPPPPGRLRIAVPSPSRPSARAPSSRHAGPRNPGREGPRLPSHELRLGDRLRRVGCR